jgi:hypothetical protein
MWTNVANNMQNIIETEIIIYEFYMKGKTQNNA